ncbi:MAG: hypothetical protein JNK49_11130 [Planctomycetes bacterium]|nr:hypothetical protein [Planctomycetota bacterium]
MDGFDSLYQQMDSQALLERHGPSLVADAKEILQQEPMARIAGTILLPDSHEAPEFRAALAKLTGQTIPEGLLVGVCPRAMLEPLLQRRVAPEHWQEEAWQAQQRLPVLVATRDGFRFGFFPLA